jgi:hypothetical protein
MAIGLMPLSEKLVVLINLMKIILEMILKDHIKHGATTLSITSLSKMTFSIKILSIRGL